MGDAQTKLEAVKATANEIAERLDADILVYNFEVAPPFDMFFINIVGARTARRKNVALLLVTEGGSADSAFRMMRFLQAKYQAITVIVPGWCKSAGTLMCIGGHELQIGDNGELGPLDVQIAKVDELDEQKSGLAAEAAFDKLQSESFKFFMQFVRDIGGSEYRITLKTASEIATKMTIGIMQPIFEKLDPVTIGEDHRSNRLALAYAERLNLHSKNLNRNRRYDALDNLLAGYESHGFVIDRKEAENLFKNVKPLTPEVAELVTLMGVDAVLPRNRRTEAKPRLEFLNDEPLQDVKKAAGSSGKEAAQAASAQRRPARAGDRSAKLSRNPNERGAKESRAEPPEALPEAAE